MKVVAVLPCFDKAGEDNRQAMTNDTYKIFDDIAKEVGVSMDFAFVVEEFMQPKSLSMDLMRDNRDRLIGNINEAAPDAVLCVGKQAAAAVLDNGAVTIEKSRRKVLEAVGLDAPLWVSFSLEQVYYKRGYADWIARDIKACMAGQTEVVVPEYTISQDLPEHWSITGPPSNLIGFDLETYPGLSPWVPNSRIRMAIVTDSTGYTQIIYPETTGVFPQWLRGVCADPEIIKAGSNIKFDHGWMTRFGMPLRGMLDTSTTKHIINEQEPLKNLKSLSLLYAPQLGAYATEQERRVKEQGGWEMVTDEQMLDYAACDGIASYASGAALQNEVFETGNTIPYTISMNTYRSLATMEHHGIRIDHDVLNDLDQRYSTKLASLRSDIFDEFGPINPNSPPQLIKAIFTACPGIDLRRNKRAVWLDEDANTSTEHAVLAREAIKFPILNTLMQYRTLSKRHGTYVTGLRPRLVTHGGYQTFVHGSFRTDVVETFRLSSSEPNLQNIPKNFETEDILDEAVVAELEELNIKRMFVSRFDGGVFMEADESQLELRIAAELSQDATLLNAFHNGEDIHAATAIKVFGDANKQHRFRAKMVNFLILYQGGARGLAARLGCSKKQAQDWMDQYFEAMPGLRKWIDATKLEVHDTLSSTNLFGYTRHFVKPYDWNTFLGWGVERQAVNTPVQGTAGVLVQIALQEVCDTMEQEGLKSVPVLTVHDSIGADTHPDEKKVVAEILKQKLEHPDTGRYGVQIDVPLVADITVGPNWAEQTKYEW